MRGYKAYAKVLLHGTPSNPRKWMLAATIDMARKIKDRFAKKHAEMPKTALDLGCGVGELSRILTTDGFKCFGIDCNPEAIEIARTNSPESEFICRNFLSFVPDEHSVISASGDVFNMLGEEEVYLFLTFLYKNLAKGGFAVFDFITDLGFNSWQDVQIEERPDFFMIQKCFYNVDKGIVKLTGFVQDGDKYERFDITEEAFSHDLGWVVQAAKGLGFQVELFSGNGNLVDSLAKDTDKGVSTLWSRLNIVLTK